MAGVPVFSPAAKKSANSLLCCVCASLPRLTYFWRRRLMPNISCSSRSYRTCAAGSLRIGSQRRGRHVLRRSEASSPCSPKLRLADARPQRSLLVPEGHEMPREPPTPGRDLTRDRRTSDACTLAEVGRLLHLCRRRRRRDAQTQNSAREGARRGPGEAVPRWFRCGSW